jgi:exodeoxyribonuclease III
VRVATWNVNSLKARQDAVERWLERAAPDILLMQETKLTDADAPVMAFAMAGYRLVHHGEGRWNGVAIAARDGLPVDDVVTNFGDGPVRDSGPGGAAANASEDDFDPFDEARMVAATVDGLRVVSLYAPNGRIVDSPFYTGKLAWFERLARWTADELTRTDTLLLGGDLNVAPTDIDVWDAAAVHGGTHVSERERAAFRAIQDLGLVDAYRAVHDEPGRFSWWDYRAGMFHKNLGMRIDHLLASPAVAARIVDAEIDREARKGPPVPSDHAPMTLDLDAPGKPYEPDWAGALARIKARTR